MRTWRLAAVAVAGIMGLAGVGAPAGAEEPDAGPSAEACFVHEAHDVFLRRAATDAEVAEWEERFADGEPTSRLPVALAGSDEWLGAEVDALYQQALDRDPDAAGRQHWIEQLRQGVMVNRVASLVYGSSEFYEGAGATPTGFVDDLYVRILGRAADSAGRAHWVGEVARLGRAAVAAVFFASVESRTRRVTDLYQRTLRRSPDGAGLAHWVAQLRTVNDVRLAVLLASSGELLAKAATGPCGAGAPAGTVSRVSIATGGTQGDQASRGPSLSADGRYVAFQSAASTLAPGVTPLEANVYLRDTELGTTTLVSHGIGGPATGPSWSPSISADGSRVAFESAAPNLVTGDSNGSWDVFVWERDTGVITMASVSSDEVQGDGVSGLPALSADGSHVAFTSTAGELAGPVQEPEGLPNQYANEVFVRDLDTGTTTKVTVTTDGHEPSFGASSLDISGDGGVVAFASAARNLVPDGPEATSVYVWERETAEITLLAADSTSPRLSGDGTRITFSSGEDVYLHDRAAGLTTPVSAGGSTQGSSISADGRYVAYATGAADVVPGDANGALDVMLLDTETGTVVRVSRAPGGAQPNGASTGGDVSADGSVVAFQSAATNLVAGDTNAALDVFVWERTPPA